MFSSVLSMIGVRYLIEFCKKVSISLWVLCCDIFTYVKCLKLMCVGNLVMTIGGGG